MKLPFGILFILFLFFLIPVNGNEKEIENKRFFLKKLDNSVGLSQNTVTCILQDSLGFMWFGTKDGLNKYDGYSFTVFRRKIGDDHSLKENFITALCMGKDKHKLWIGTFSGICVYDMSQESFSHFTQKSSNTDIEISKPINDIMYDDKQGILWIATQGQGLFSYDEKRGILSNHSSHDAMVNSDIRSITIDSRGFLWFTIEKVGLFYSTDNLSTVSQFVHKDLSDFMSVGTIHDMMCDSNNHLYMVSDQKGFISINPFSQKIRKFIDSDIGGNRVFMRRIVEFSENVFWIGTESGIYIIDTRTLQYSHFKHELGDPYSLSDNAIHSLYKDREGNMWIGSYFGGINYYSTQSAIFEKYYPIPGKKGMSGERVGEFCEDPSGDIWIATEDGGLNLLSSKTKQIIPFMTNELYNNIHGLYHDGKNHLWVGTFSEGFYKINLTNKNITHYKRETTNNALLDNNIYAIFKDHKKVLWIGTGIGLQLFNENTYSFITVEELKGKLIRDIVEDENGNIFCATGVNGLFSYNRQRKKWINYSYKMDDDKSLPHNNVLSIFIDSKKQVWITTQGGGFAKFNDSEGTFTRYSTYNKLPNDVAYQILEDEKGLFWISTNDGLLHFNPETENFFNYTLGDGLLSKQFNYQSALRASDGTFYLGSLNGFISFTPDIACKDNYASNVVLTDFLLFNKKVIVGDMESPLNQSITFLDKITLKHNQNYFSLKFANLNYNRKAYQYLYKLEGFDSEWLPTNESNIIYYPNVKYGKFKFRLKTIDGDNDLITFPIEILPPWWQSNYAYLIYTILILCLMYVIYRYLSKRNALKVERRLTLFEQDKEKEIYASKIEFFTNITHEIRTPLTLIKSPLENIIKNKNISEDIKEDLDVIEKNTERLQDLTNQLLDFRKVEKQLFHLTFEKYNIIELIDSILIRFNQLIRLNNLELNTKKTSNDLYAYVDKESIIKIVSNLLTNAIKNAETYINIEIVNRSIKGEKYFDLVIENDGDIIPMSQRNRIFKPFVQYHTDKPIQKTGTGLGLALARSLAELHQGYLMMDSVEEVNSFRLTIPYLQKWIKKTNGENIESTAIEFQVQKNNNADITKTILVVEDDEALLAYMTRLLSSCYNILGATNGVKALKILENHVVNLVLTDIMMANMDGYDLCKEIKTNISSSHIPVIFLSAKNSLSSKIESLELGIDAYVEKPFSNEFLMATISNLLSNREKMIEAFKMSTYALTDSTILSKTDENFIKTIYKVIEENLENPEFDQDDFAMSMNMSKSSLYRKIKGLFDICPNDFIRLTKIKKAAQLFDGGNDRVAEVCYMVGFSSPSYFAKCFFRQFDVTPKDYIDSIRDQKKKKLG